MTPRKLSIADERLAADLRELFGSDAGTRLAAADVARELFKRTVYTNRVAAREAAFAVMWDYEAKGFVNDSPGQRGGAGWALSEQGAALIAASTIVGRN